MGWQTKQTFARLPEGNFISRISTLSVNYSVTPFVTFANLVQYNNSQNLGWQSRFRSPLRPGSDLFVVFNQGWQQDPEGQFHFAGDDSKLAAKIQYTFRF